MRQRGMRYDNTIDIAMLTVDLKLTANPNTITLDTNNSSQSMYSYYTAGSITPPKTQKGMKLAAYRRINDKITYLPHNMQPQTTPHLLRIVVAAASQCHRCSARPLDGGEHVEILLESLWVRRKARHGNHSGPQAGQIRHCEVERRRVHQETRRPPDKAQVAEEVGCQRVRAPAEVGVCESVNLCTGIINKGERCFRRALFSPKVDGFEKTVGSLHRVGGGWLWDSDGDVDNPL